jgi:hypothetical protein
MPPEDMNAFQPVYGNEQALYTMNRAAYGDSPAAMMSAGAGGFYGGAAQGLSNMASDVGRYVMPVTYTPPSRVYVGYYGGVVQETGLVRGLASQVGLGPSVPRGTTAYEYHIAASQDVGERVGAGAAAAISVSGGLAAGMAASPFGAMAGRFVGGAIGGALGSVFGPLGTAAGAVVGSGIGALAGGIAGYAAGTVGANAVTSAIGQRREIEGFLETSGFRFATTGSDLSAGSRLGGGIAPGRRTEIAEFLRSRDVADINMNTEDLTKILQTSTQQGLFAGTRDVEDFKTKFKDIVESVKTVTKVLHTTLEDGVKTIKDLKGIGIDPSQVKSVIMQADVTGKVAGRTAAEMIGIGLQGAEMFRGTGVSMEIGMQANMMNLSAIRAARDAGTLAQEVVAQAGGEEALAQRMTARGLQYAQTDFGRGLNAAFLGAGGGFNQAQFMSTMMTGGGNFVGLAQQAAANLSSPASIIQYEAHQEKFLSQMGKTFGGQGLQMAQMGGLMSMAEYYAKATGSSTEDAYKFYGKRILGLDETTIQTQLAQMRGGGAAYEAEQRGAQAVHIKSLAEESQQRFIVNRWTAEIGDWAKQKIDIAARPLNRMVTNIGEGFVRFKEEELFGMRRVSTAGISGESFTGFDLGVQKDKIKAELDAGKINIDIGGVLTTSAGEQLKESIKQSGGTFGYDIGKMGAGGNLILERGTGVGTRIAAAAIGGVGLESLITRGETSIRYEDLLSMQKESRKFRITAAQASEMEKAGRLAEVQGGLGQALVKGAAAIDLKDTGKAMEQLSQMAFGKKAKDLSEEEVAKLTLDVQGTVYEELMNTTRRNASVVDNAVYAAKVGKLDVAVKKYFEAEDHMLKQVGLKASDIPKEVATAMATTMISGSELAAMKDGDPRKAEAKRKHDLLLKDTLVKASKTGLEESKINQVVSALTSPSSQAVSDAKDFAAISMSIDDVRKGLGTGILAEAIRTDLGTKWEGLSSEKIKEIEAIAGRVELGGIRALEKADVERLREAGVSPGIQSRWEAYKDLTSVLDKAKGPKGIGEHETEIGKALKKAGVESKDLVQTIKDLKTGGVTPNELVDKLESRFAKATATDEQVITAGGAGLLKDDQQKNAYQVMVQQTNINATTLAVMQGLAARLGVK